MARLSGGPHRELIAVHLADNNGPGFLQSGYDGGVEGGAVVFEHFRTATGSSLRGANIVLDRYGNAGQGASRFTFGDAAIDVSGCGQGRLIKGLSECIGRVCLDAVQRISHDFYG